MTSVIPEVKPPNLSLHQSRLPGSRDDGSRRVQNDGTRRVPLLARQLHVVAKLLALAQLELLEAHSTGLSLIHI